jgi:hypothetical protein
MLLNGQCEGVMMMMMTSLHLWQAAPPPPPVAPFTATTRLLRFSGPRPRNSCVGASPRAPITAVRTSIWPASWPRIRRGGTARRSITRRVSCEDGDDDDDEEEEEEKSNTKIVISGYFC